MISVPASELMKEFDGLPERKERSPFVLDCWQLFYKGVWHWVVSTDLIDDIGGFVAHEPPSEMLKRCRLGARVGLGPAGPSIRFIMAMTNG